MVWLIVWIICGVLGGIIGSSKGRQGLGFGLGFLLGPIGLIIIAVMSEDKEAISEIAIASNQERKCPFCAESIKIEAKVCKHCGRDVPPVPSAKAYVEERPKEEWLCSKCGKRNFAGTNVCHTCAAPKEIP